MASNDTDFMVFAVKLLFRRIKEGHVKFVDEKVPQTLRAVEAVKFDVEGNPVYETINPPVRALANLVYAHEVQKLEKEAEERERNSPLHDLLSKPTEVTGDILKACAAQENFSGLAFELYKEAAVVTGVCAHVYMGYEANAALNRNQAICSGLLVRIAKFMTAVAQLVSQAERGDVVFALNRSIFESATNLRFLTLKDDGAIYDQFVRSGLAPERELYDIIQRNIRSRADKAVLPIETRMLNSIDRVSKLSGFKIEEIDSRYREWGGGIRNRLRELGEDDLYVATQRIPSHAVHGTWVDLVLHHLEPVGEGFTPDPSWSAVDSRLLLPTCILVLAAAQAYLRKFLGGDVPELRPLHRRIDDLYQKMRKVEQAHEDWLNNQKADRSQR